MATAYQQALAMGQAFYNAGGTFLSPAVWAAWFSAEGVGSTGWKLNNPLNIHYYPGQPGAIGNKWVNGSAGPENLAIFAPNGGGLQAVVQTLKSAASPYYSNILNSGGKSAMDQLTAIWTSGWAGGPNVPNRKTAYNNGSSLFGSYNSVMDALGNAGGKISAAWSSFTPTVTSGQVGSTFTPTLDTGQANLPPAHGPLNTGDAFKSLSRAESFAAMQPANSPVDNWPIIGGFVKGGNAASVAPVNIVIGLVTRGVFIVIGLWMLSIAAGTLLGVSLSAVQDNPGVQAAEEAVGTVGGTAAKAFV